MLNLTGSLKYVISFIICISQCTIALANDIDLANIILKETKPDARTVHKEPLLKNKILNAKHITVRMKCFGREEVSHSLEGKLGRTAQWWGLSPNGYLMEVYRNAGSSEWTGLLTMPDGKSSCIIAGGHASIKPPEKIR